MSAQHYLFAHRALPSSLWEGDSVLGILTNPENQDYLHRMWDSIPQWDQFAAFCAHRSQPFPLLSATGPGETLQPDPAAVARVIPPDGISFRSYWLGNEHLVVLITLPPPDSGTEAHFIAITHSPEVQYFTLERGITGGTVLGGWKPDRHLNFGPGPDADPDLFLYAVCRLLGIPESIEPPTRQQCFGMAKTAQVDMEMPAPLPDAEAAQVALWEAAAKDAMAEPTKRRFSWFRRRPSPRDNPQLAEAAKFYRRILDLRMKVQGVENTEATLANSALVRVLIAAGKSREALSLCQTWWKQCRRYRCPGHQETHLATQQLALAYEGLGNLEAAERIWNYRHLYFGLTRGRTSPQARLAQVELTAFSARKNPK